MQETDLAWAAGFVDGEGSIATPVRMRDRNRRDYSLALYVGQVDPRPLLRLRSYFGGEVVLRTGSGKGRPMFMWRISGTTAEAALRTLLPHLMVKAEQARMAIELRDLITGYPQKGRKGRSVDPETTAARMALVGAIKADKWRHHAL